VLKDIMVTIESSKAAMVKFVHDFRDERIQSLMEYFGSPISYHLEDKMIEVITRACPGSPINPAPGEPRP
jgi:hypothetical protein